VVLVHGSRAQAEAIKQTAATLLGDQLRLTLSPEKTRITHVDDGFDFLGLRIVRLPRPGRTPAAFSFATRAAVNRLKHRITTLTARSTTGLPLDALLHALNPVLRG
jgi:RNA-directed DNA polymerase